MVRRVDGMTSVDVEALRRRRRVKTAEPTNKLYRCQIRVGTKEPRIRGVQIRQRKSGCYHFSVNTKLYIKAKLHKWYVPCTGSVGMAR